LKQKPEVLQGILALMVLKTLDVLGPLHGFGVARRIEQISGNLLTVNQGTLGTVNSTGPHNHDPSYAL
jgi:PadR family transcriptional regulator PadR